MSSTSVPYYLFKSPKKSRCSRGYSRNKSGECVRTSAIARSKVARKRVRTRRALARGANDAFKGLALLEKPTKRFKCSKGYRQKPPKSGNCVARREYASIGH